jgi:lysozyme
MEVITIASQIARQFEGFRSRPYRCPAGVATIGYGTTHYPGGKAVTMKDAPVSQETGEQYLQYEMMNSMMKAFMYCPILLMDDKKLAAITDFVYNLGPGRLQTSTLRRRINQQDWPLVRKELMRWTRGGGKVLKGLVRRRKVEASLI